MLGIFVHGVLNKLCALFQMGREFKSFYLLKIKIKHFLLNKKTSPHMRYLREHLSLVKYNGPQIAAMFRIIEVSWIL